MLGLTAVTSGCHKDDVQFYRVSKGESEGAEIAPAMVAGASDPRIHWVVPSGWDTLPPGQMLVGKFSAPTPDGRSALITVVPLPGEAGNEVDNVNRWRGQVKLPPVTAAEIKSENLSVGGKPAKRYDLTSAEVIPPSQHKTRLVVVSALVDGTSWFFKLTGDEDLVATRLAAFDQFLKSVVFGSVPATAGIPVTPTPVPDTPVPQVSGAAPGSGPQWEVPQGWKTLPSSQMKVGNFSIGEGESSASVTVTTFPGDVGGALANVNRWRGQIGLGPVSEGEMGALVTALDVDGGKAMLVDMTGPNAGTGQKTRLIAVTIRRGENSWFFKMMGDEALVAKQKAGFIHFVQSTRLPNG